MEPTPPRVAQALAERVASLPASPGVYLFKNARGRVLYVGKAQSLRQRVRSYLKPGADGRLQLPKLMERAVTVDVVVTDGVKDALLLENELIKQHKPAFNVRLRDDKQYLALRLDPNEEWPRLTQVRKFARDGAWYFGPYTSSSSLREVVSNLRRIFPLRSCSNAVFRDYARRGRPCIEFEMNRCLGPCCDRVDGPAYTELVEGTALFLRGRSDQLRADLEARMQAAAAEERFEEAGRLRDRLGAVERTVERQRIVAEAPIDRDVFGLARDGGEVEIQALFVRDGRVVGNADYGFSQVALDDGSVLESFLSQFYGSGDRHPVPDEVLTSAEVGGEEGLAALLSERATKRVPLRAPQRGDSRRLVEMASHNAELGLARRLAARESLDVALEELRERLGLTVPPKRVECYDVSTLHGTFSVASRVTFEDGQPVKADYRRYRIHDAKGGDDYGCLREVVSRRLARVEAEPLPDLLMVDGGKGQLGVVLACLADAGLEVETVGIAKERDADSPSVRVRRGGGLKSERLFRPNRKDAILLAPSSRGLLFLQRVRDESHRFAIDYQRSLRRRIGMTSILEALPGIGPAKRRALLRTLGSLAAVRRAGEAELQAVPGVSARDAATLHSFFGEAAEGPPAVEEPLSEPLSPAGDAQTDGKPTA
ncbi:MAG: excinuclease ABC subunit UvrC [Deltaproteobacteria bacterium]|nr:excinuclease ABC subunit UvrC [Deltaproteobacteria bacterium]